MIRRLPPLQHILPVYAVIAAIIFGWSVFAFIWKLPSWMLFLNAGEILAILSYTLSVNLIESVFWLGILLLIGMVLPSGFLRDHFSVRGTIMSLLVLSSLAVFINRYGDWGQSLLKYSTVWVVVTILASILIAYLSSKILFLSNAASWISDRSMVFLYLYIPLAIMALIAVVIRNVF